MEIGKAVRVARNRAGYSQEALAHKAEISIGGLRGIEQGTRPDPHFSSLTRIADALGMSITELTTLTEDEDERLASIVEKHRDLLDEVYNVRANVAGDAADNEEDLDEDEFRERVCAEYERIITNLPEGWLEGVSSELSWAIPRLLARPHMSVELLQVVELKHALSIVVERVAR